MTWEYLAGFFDGEGSILCYDKANGWRVTKLTVTNTNTEVLEEIHTFLSSQGIKCAVRKFRETRNPNWNDCSALYVTGAKNVYTMLFRLEPLLIVKRMEALIAIEWLWDLAERAAAGEFDGFRNNYAKHVYLQIIALDEVLAEQVEHALTEEAT